MPAVTKQNSNSTEARISEETALGTADPSAVWELLEPNSYSEAAGRYTKVARNPIGGDRQRKKGVLTDLDAAFGFNTDLTHYNLQALLQGFFRADLRRKVEFGGSGEITGVTATDYQAASGLDAFEVGDLVFGRKFSKILGNNGVKRVTAVLATAITVAETLAVETPPAAASLTRVGVQTAAGDLEVNVTGPYPVITSTTLDFTTLGLTPGEPIWVGGDVALTRFSNEENNGMLRVRSVAANALTIDKASKGPMVVEAGAAQTVQLFFGRVLKNESTTSLIKRRSYQIERTLGAPDDDFPAQIQSEYFTKAIPNTAGITYAQADKIMVDLGFVCGDHEQRTGAEGLKAGTRPAIEAAPAQNTSSHLKRVRIARYINGSETPAALIAFVQNLDIMINNGVEPLKALTVLGAFEFSDGDFVVSGNMTGMFSDIASIQAIRNNDDLTLDLFQFLNNAGIAIDLPLVTFGDGGAVVEKDRPITQPITFDAASGEEIDVALDHTMLMVFFDYLPSFAGE